MTPSLLTYENDYLTLIVLSYILVRRRYGCAINKVHNAMECHTVTLTPQISLILDAIHKCLHGYHSST